MTKGRIRLLLAGIISLLLLSSFSIFTIIRDGGRKKKAIDKYHDEVLASKEAIAEFILLTERSKALTVNWVYLVTDVESKVQLRELQDQDYPKLKQTIKRLMPVWSESQRKEINLIFEKSDALIEVAREGIMANLQTFKNYEDPTTKFLAENHVESEIIPMADDILKRLKALRENYVSNDGAWETAWSVNRISDLRLLILCINMFAAGVIGLIIVLSAPKKTVTDTGIQHPDLTTPNNAERKVQLIEWLANVEDKEIIQELESLRKNVTR